MGYMCHHAILVTSWDAEHIQQIHEKAKEVFTFGNVSELGKPQMNYYTSFAVFPDGSKEGWIESDSGNAQREIFLAWLRVSGLYCSWCEVQYDDGENYNYMVSASGGVQ